MNSRDRQICQNCFSACVGDQEPSQWDINKVQEFLEFWNLEKYRDKTIEKNIQGNKLKELEQMTEQQLMELFKEDNLLLIKKLKVLLNFIQKDDNEKSEDIQEDLSADYLSNRNRKRRTIDYREKQKLLEEMNQKASDLSTEPISFWTTQDLINLLDVLSISSNKQLKQIITERDLDGFIICLILPDMKIRDVQRNLKDNVQLTNDLLQFSDLLIAYKFQQYECDQNQFLSQALSKEDQAIDQEESNKSIEMRYKSQTCQTQNAFMASTNLNDSGDLNDLDLIMENTTEQTKQLSESDINEIKKTDTECTKPLDISTTLTEISDNFSNNEFQSQVSMSERGSIVQSLQESNRTLDMEIQQKIQYQNNQKVQQQIGSKYRNDSNKLQSVREVFDSDTITEITEQDSEHMRSNSPSMKIRGKYQFASGMYSDNCVKVARNYQEPGQKNRKSEQAKSMYEVSMEDQKKKTQAVFNDDDDFYDHENSTYQIGMREANSLGAYEKQQQRDQQEKMSFIQGKQSNATSFVTGKASLASTFSTDFNNNVIFVRDGKSKTTLNAQNTYDSLNDYEDEEFNQLNHVEEILEQFNEPKRLAKIKEDEEKKIREQEAAEIAKQRQMATSDLLLDQAPTIAVKTPQQREMATSELIDNQPKFNPPQRDFASSEICEDINQIRPKKDDYATSEVLLDGYLNDPKKNTPKKDTNNWTVTEANDMRGSFTYNPVQNDLIKQKSSLKKPTLAQSITYPDEGGFNYGGTQNSNRNQLQESVYCDQMPPKKTFAESLLLEEQDKPIAKVGLGTSELVLQHKMNSVNNSKGSGDNLLKSDFKHQRPSMFANGLSQKSSQNRSRGISIMPDQQTTSSNTLQASVYFDCGDTGKKANFKNRQTIYLEPVREEHKKSTDSINRSVLPVQGDANDEIKRIISDVDNSFGNNMPRRRIAQTPKFIENTEQIEKQLTLSKENKDFYTKIQDACPAIPFDPFNFSQFNGLKFKYKGQDGVLSKEKSINLQGAQVGRSQACQISFPEEATISAVHARIFFKIDGFFIQDMGSSCGTFLKVQSIQLQEEMQVVLGYKVEISIASIQYEEHYGKIKIRYSKPRQNKVEEVRTIKEGETLTIGRDRQCQIQIKSKIAYSLGNVHAKLTYMQGNFYLEDNDSKNGTWLRLSHKKEKSDPFFLTDVSRLRIANIYELKITSIQTTVQ